MTTPYAEACEILDEIEEMSLAWKSRANVSQCDSNMIHLHKILQDHGHAIAEFTTTMTQLAKAQLSQAQAPKKVHAMEGANMMANKRSTKVPQGQTQVENYVQEDSGFEQDDSYNEQEEEVAVPSDIVVNPKGGHNTGNAMAVITRNENGRNAPTSSGGQIVYDDQVMQEEEIPKNVVQPKDEVRIDFDDSVEETQEKVNPSREHIIDIPEQAVQKARTPLLKPPPSYPQRLAKNNGENQFKKFIQMMKSHSINVPLVEALEQMLGYAKFMKDIVTNKRSINFETIKVTNEVSEIVHSMAPKLKDPGAFMISCTIGSAEFAKALCDLWASINLKPYSVLRL
uniref:Uncharacterized protein LOC104210934 n=1 Tax=Nicotiana sylvestris TaxID=4096 RepID=A0A1U7UZP4_NICSY|nr:PREDICTED: uncharacterized protein LOC104210934 [Nicotiana sylvestris]